MHPERTRLGQAKRWVVKIGSALLTDDGRGLDLDSLEAWADQIARLKQSGKEIVLASSGAVAEGMNRLGWQRRPHAIYELQAAAAIGQMGLVQAYESRFQRHNIHSAQILLTHEDLRDRCRYLNARSTLRRLLELGAIPVVNENDTVATDEIRFGDNDTLAALMANLVDAQLLVILTDQDGVYDRNPSEHPDAALLGDLTVDDPLLDRAAGPSGGHLGRGGMITKISAARRAARSATATIIAPGRLSAVLERLAAAEEIGTLLTPGRAALAARKRWMANQLQVSGTLQVDAGAARVLRDSGRSLLAVGVTRVDGNFTRGEMVRCIDPSGRELARGLANYGADEARRIRGRPSSDIEAVLGYVDEPELIHRDNLVIL